MSGILTVSACMTSLFFVKKSSMAGTGRGDPIVEQSLSLGARDLTNHGGLLSDSLYRLEYLRSETRAGKRGRL